MAMKCEKCNKEGALYYIDYLQENMVHQFDPYIWELCTRCAAKTPYQRPVKYIEFLKECLADKNLQKTNNISNDNSVALPALIRWLIFNMQQLMCLEKGM